MEESAVVKKEEECKRKERVSEGVKWRKSRKKKKRERSGHGFDMRLVFFCLLNGCDIIFSGIFPSNSSGISEFVKVAGNFFFSFY